MVLNFSDPDSPYKLEDTNILNPEWVTAGVYRIINDNALATRHHGVLTARHRGAVLPDRTYPADKKDFIIGMMKKFELCFDYAGGTGRSWLVPEALQKNEPPLEEWRDEKRTLNFRFRYDVLPGGLICRFVVRRRDHLTDPPVYWRTGAVLRINGNPVLVRRLVDNKTIAIQVAGPKPRRREALAVVREEVRAINRTVPSLKYTELVPLPDDPAVEVPYQHLLTLEELGREDFVPEGADRAYRVKDLLDPVELPDARRPERGGGTFHVRGNVYMGDDKRRYEFDKPKFHGPTFFGDISGNARVAIRAIGPGRRDDAPDLKAVLDAFLDALKEATEKQDLSADEAKDAVDEVEVIASASNAPGDPGMLERADKALRGLGRIVGGVAALGTHLVAVKDAAGRWFAN